MSFYKISFYSIPNRTVPLQITDNTQATIQKQSHLINIIRSPHIDKKSWEQFQFFLKKQIMVCNDQKQIKQYMAAKRVLRLMFAVLRLRISKTEIKIFQTVF